MEGEQLSNLLKVTKLSDWDLIRDFSDCRACTLSCFSTPISGHVIGCSGPLPQLYPGTYFPQLKCPTFKKQMICEKRNTDPWITEVHPVTVFPSCFQSDKAIILPEHIETGEAALLVFHMESSTIHQEVVQTHYILHFYKLSLMFHTSLVLSTWHGTWCVVGCSITFFPH